MLFVVIICANLFDIKKKIAHSNADYLVRSWARLMRRKIRRSTFQE